MSERPGNDKIIILIFIAKRLHCLKLLRSVRNKHSGHGFGKKNFPNTRLGLRLFQHKDCPGVPLLYGKNPYDILILQNVFRINIDTLQFLCDPNIRLPFCKTLLGNVHTIPCEPEQFSDTK